MTAKIDAAVLSTVADVLEEIQAGVQTEFKTAEEGSILEAVWSKLDDILGGVIENVRERQDNDETEDNDL